MAPPVQNQRADEAAPPIRVLLVDDNARFLEVTTTLLKTDPRLRVVGWALSGREALTKIGRLQPDLVLMDVALLDLNGLELTRHLKKRPCPPRIIIVTVHAEPAYRQAAQEARADGFRPKPILA